LPDGAESPLVCLPFGCADEPLVRLPFGCVDELLVRLPFGCVDELLVRLPFGCADELLVRLPFGCADEPLERLLLERPPPLPVAVSRVAAMAVEWKEWSSNAVSCDLVNCSMPLSKLTSSASQNDRAVPTAPARAVRPMRCT
jgi:hypothetical protein